MNQFPKIKTLILFLLFLQKIVFAQDWTVDSLKNLIKSKNVHDTTAVKIYNLIGENIYASKPDSAILYWQKVVEISEKRMRGQLPEKEKHAFLIETSTALNNIGYVYQFRGNPTQALYYLKKSLDISKRLNDLPSIANCLNNIGYNYQSIGNTVEAINCYNQSLSATIKSGDKDNIIGSLNLLADLHNGINDHKSALSYFRKSLTIAIESKNQTREAMLYMFLGNTYFKLNKMDTALMYDRMSLDLNKKLNLYQKVANCYNNIGSRYFALKNYEKALENFKAGLALNEQQKNTASIHVNLENVASTFLVLDQPQKANEYYLKALALSEQANDKLLMFNSYERLANSCIILKDRKKGEQYALKALAIAKDIGFPSLIKGAANVLYGIYFGNKDYKNALEMHKLTVQMRDSLNNVATRKASLNSELKYEYEKKAAADSVKTAGEKKIFEAKSEKEKTQRYSLYGGIFLIALFALFMFNRYKKTNRQKFIIEQKEKETQKQKQLIEEKNKEILDSINYAKRLQEAILPSDNIWKQKLPESFILYKPKDIVAGDFYWMETVKDAADGENDLVMIAAADCTGHGVPGALVSVVCSNALNRVVKEFGIYKPNEILDKVKILVLETFEKSEKDVKDGMDISLCVLSKSKESGTTLHWAGANNPLWYIKNGEFREIKGDKQPIGKHIESKPFNAHTLHLAKNDSFYIFTDGFADQFGGAKGKKFKYKQLQKLLLDSHTLNPQAQKDLLNTSFEVWKNSLEQVDDVCIIGVRL